MGGLDLIIAQDTFSIWFLEPEEIILQIAVIMGLQQLESPGPSSG